MPGISRRQQIEQMLEQDPEDAFLQYALAMEWMSEKEPAKALAQLQQLLAMQETYVPAYLQAGQLLAQLGQPLEACILLDRGVQQARMQNDVHAAEEMAGLRQSLTT